MSHFLYIAESIKTGKLYIGTSSDVNKRIKKHNSGAAASTRSYLPYKLIYKEKFSTKKEALQRELYLKKLKSRKYIERLVSSSSSR